MKRFNKKTILFAAAGLLVLIGLVVGVCVLVSRRPKFITLEQAGLGEQSELMLTAAHGLSALAPENSAAALELAGKNGFAGALFEVRRTADGVWVVMQEEDVRRMTDGRGKVSEMTYKQLLQLRIDKGRGLKRYKDSLTVPSLAQALTICDQTGTAPVIDVKQGGADCVEELFALIGARRRKESVLIFGEEEQLTAAQALLESSTLRLGKENVLLCRFVERLNGKTLAEAKKTPDIAVCFPGAEGGAEAVRQFADEGLTLFALNVNKPKLAKALYDAGVRRFTTDRLSYQPISAKEETRDKKEDKHKSKDKEKTAEKEQKENPTQPTEAQTEKPSATAAQ